MIQLTTHHLRMSSGSILLQQLRGRSCQSSKSSSSHSCNQNTNKFSSDGNENTEITSSYDGADNATPVTQTNPSEVGAMSQKKIISALNTTTKTKVIEVCLGPDCAVAGGGAALLEIEDLILQRRTNKSNDKDDDTIIVKAGGCRDQCTEGPNVRILSCTMMVADFHKVNSPDACRRVVHSSCLEEASPTTSASHDAADYATVTTTAANSNNYYDSTDASSSDYVVARLLLRKEDAKRWKAHREKAAKERRLQAISRNQCT